jgi:dihydroneopterin aldolase
MSDIGRSERRLVDDRRVARLTDKIEVRGLRVHGHHGVYDQERATGQAFVLDVALDVDSQIAARTDNLDDTIDYARLIERIADLVRSTRFNLIEALGAHIADDLLTMRRVASTAGERVSGHRAGRGAHCSRQRGVWAVSASAVTEPAGGHTARVSEECGL